MDHGVQHGRSRHLKITLPMHVGSQCPLVVWLPNMHGRHTVPVIGRSGIFHVEIDILLGEHAHAISRRSDDRQKRLSPSLYIVAKAFRRHNTSIKCIELKACKTAFDNLY
jgi:hypothetical protein